MRAFDMSRFVRVIATEGRVRGSFVVHATEQGVFEIEVLEAVLYTEDRSWGRVINAHEFDIVIGDGDDRSPRVGRNIHPNKAADVEEFRPLIDALLPLVVRAFEGGVGSVVDSAESETKREKPAHVSGVGHVLCGPECPALHPPKQSPVPEEPVGPDCREGKHRACDGKAWRESDDAIVDCACCGRGHQTSGVQASGGDRG